MSLVRFWRRIGHTISGHPPGSCHQVMGQWFCARCGAVW